MVTLQVWCNRNHLIWLITDQVHDLTSKPHEHRCPFVCFLCVRERSRKGLHKAEIKSEIRHWYLDDVLQYRVSGGGSVSSRSWPLVSWVPTAAKDPAAAAPAGELVLRWDTRSSYTCKGEPYIYCVCVCVCVCSVPVLHFEIWSLYLSRHTEVSFSPEAQSGTLQWHNIESSHF